MKTTTARAITYSVVALLAYGALTHLPSLPASARPAALVAERPVAPAPFLQREDTVGDGESLQGVLARVGVARLRTAAALRAAAAAGRLDARRIPAGMTVSATVPSGASEPSEVILHLAADHAIRLSRSGDGWIGADERLPWTVDTAAAAAEIGSTLYEALDHAAPDLPRGARAELAWSLADIFEYRVDMSSDLQKGDSIRVLYERARAPNGLVRVGRILAATITADGDAVSAIRFGRGHGAGEFYDQDGKSLKEHYLRAPLEFRRISSTFGLRLHPILGIWKQHKGTDYAAAQGTPVRAIGDGRVVKAGWSHGYGNVLEIRLRNGFVTRYGHLRNFARGIRPGAAVEVGSTVAYVGTTGLSTAPHLHFEMLVNGVQRDPRVALKQLKGGEPIDGGQRAAFERVRRDYLASLDAHTRVLASAPTTVASATEVRN